MKHNIYNNDNNGIFGDTIGCRYNVVQYIVIHTTMQWQQQNINQTLESKTHPYLIPRVCYKVSVVSV